jgi:hypothetical protein
VYSINLLGFVSAVKDCFHKIQTAGAYGRESKGNSFKGMVVCRERSHTQTGTLTLCDRARNPDQLVISNAFKRAVTAFYLRTLPISQAMKRQ